jgi:Cu+-exporting ATPase
MGGEKEGGNMTQTKLKITGMHCAGCAASVEKALKVVKGVSSAAVDLAANQASVEFDPAKTDTQALAAAVKKAGFNTA